MSSQWRFKDRLFTAYEVALEFEFISLVIQPQAPEPPCFETCKLKVTRARDEREHISQHTAPPSKTLILSSPRTSDSRPGVSSPLLTSPRSLDLHPLVAKNRTEVQGRVNFKAHLMGWTAPY